MGIENLLCKAIKLVINLKSMKTWRTNFWWIWLQKIPINYDIDSTKDYDHYSDAAVGDVLSKFRKFSYHPIHALMLWLNFSYYYYYYVCYCHRLEMETTWKIIWIVKDCWAVTFTSSELICNNSEKIRWPDLDDKRNWHI